MEEAPGDSQPDPEPTPDDSDHAPEPPRAPRNRRPAIVARCDDSPYFGDPFAPAAYLGRTRASREPAPVRIPPRGPIPPPGVCATARRYRAVEPGDYAERSARMRSGDAGFAAGRRGAYRAQFSDTPYHEDQCRAREDSIARSLGRARIRNEKAAAQRRRENAEVRAAKRESYRHDVYHLDEMYSKQFRALRVVPVSDRRDTNLPRDKLPFI
jgi:hypothetical protein